MKDYTQVERDNAALTIREYAFGQMNMLRMLGDEDAANNLQEAINMAIAALREKQQRERGCEWCTDGNEYLCKDEGWDYCPWCGRQLSGNPEQVKEDGE